MRFSALVLTHNEERHIAACLASLAPARRVVVVDSGSTDRTLELVRRHAPRAVALHRPFDTFSGQRNFALRTAFEPGEWVLHLDADERLPAPLARELARLRPGSSVACNIASLMHFRGRAIPRSSGFPAYQTRLTRAGAFEFVEVGHGQKAPPELGELPRLRCPYHHHPLENGLAAWFERHNRYSDLEAAEILARRRPYSLPQALRDPIARRQWLKQAAHRLPGRAGWVYAWLLLGRGGLFEGREGRDYCRMRYLYESMIDLKVRAMR